MRIGRKPHFICNREGDGSPIRRCITKCLHSSYGYHLCPIHFKDFFHNVGNNREVILSLHFAPKEKLWFVLLDGTNTVLFYSVFKAQCVEYIEQRS